ncbi:MAG: PhzF family phenazine biosynthesis protein [Bacillota bacterium]|nr:PhzF family phenazine biosynthesis protein [Bacillota bacterium]
MDLFIVDAFTDHIFGGNQAGVVLLDKDQSFPEPSVMQKIAAELKHSETAFVKISDGKSIELRYFTPECEVDLCGHATISSFTVLRNEKMLGLGNYAACTKAGDLNISVGRDVIWMEMAPGRIVKRLSPEESSELYRAFGLKFCDKPENFYPCVADTGLSDIMLPVKSKENLYSASQNRAEVVELSKKHGALSVHMFFCPPAPNVTAECRNFSPLCGIDEEAATGTSNGALTYLLFSMGLIRENEENVFVQGSSMGKPSVILSRIGSDKKVYIGGSAVISIKGCIKL